MPISASKQAQMFVTSIGAAGAALVAGCNEPQIAPKPLPAQQPIVETISSTNTPTKLAQPVKVTYPNDGAPIADPKLGQGGSLLRRTGEAQQQLRGLEFPARIQPDPIGKTPLDVKPLIPATEDSVVFMIRTEGSASDKSSEEACRDFQKLLASLGQEASPFKHKKFNRSGAVIYLLKGKISPSIIGDVDKQGRVTVMSSKQGEELCKEYGWKLE